MTTAFVWISMAVFFVLAVFFFVAPGYSFSGCVCLGISVVILGYYLLGLLGRHHLMLAKVMKTVLSCLLCFGILAAALTMMVIQKAAKGDPDTKNSYLVVLGAGVRGTVPSTILSDRIDAAVSYMQENPEVICIVSGGQEQGEDISEAQCMFEHITAAGIDPERIWMEDRSTSTWENFVYSLELIEAKTGSRPERLSVLSNEFHLYRAGMVAEKCGITVSGVPATTSRTSLWVNYTMREIAAVWYYVIFGGD